MATERIPPHNLEAEQSLIGSLLIDKDSLVSVADRLSPDDFYRDSHRLLFDTILELFERHEPIDILALGNRLEERGILQKIGGRAYLVELSNAVPTSAHVVHYAEIIQKKATLRRLLQAASQITKLSYEEEEDIEATLDLAEHELFNVSGKFNKNSFVPIRSVLSGAFERIDELHRERGKLRGLATGYPELDSLLGGLQKSDLIILAARPSVGKTSLALDMARHVGVKGKVPVALFSLEMAKEQLVDRMICAQGNVDLWKLRTGRLSDRDDDFPRIGKALGDLSEAPIFIDDNAMLNVMQLRTKARRLKTEHGLGLIIIDYLQLMEGRMRGNSDNRVQEVAEISRGLKQIARELDIPVVALAQLSRAVEATKPAIPRLSHLRDSGSIEQDADVVMFLYRKAVDRNYQPEDLSPEEKNLAELHIAKHRNGPTGVIRLFFDGRRTSFLSLERRQQITPPANTRSQIPPNFSPKTTMIPPPIDPSPGMSPSLPSHELPSH
ncbi:MAG: Replicative DNA helicase [Candidatus Uhrbacteria bacterium GW2011_GWE2_40_58]|nr:MAG: Replicative DNA helicase [Candidatus Uhrbacteria bacterium GW2011_GWF2_40_263]KKR67071.1 MAG: Replicative DNA helicase [Candidatus Uhrbacteria bacterium GW2011_GWE2_40_58]OGL93986.1 MAG: replicative DNA helicase [Candidatus Uhrbacteria bacterium RIFOXYA2_FULL_40_9]OGL97818.1 MAG: replicative DNA helicase [Candidatus Uhrbacteria bacterium RIFOXYB2_FULL_41_18]HBK35237.1 replicative DNA helicase [Candidatus Uhrbacteria bacterium]